MNLVENQSENELPIFGIQINDGISSPFADLYLDTFPEQYDVE